MSTEAEALLLEQNFIKQYKPRFNIRLRDDKSYPYIAIALDEDFPRVYFTRERHRRGRAYFGPYSNAKKVRDTLDLLQKVFLFRSCEGREPGPAQRLALPGLLHQALRGALRRLRRPPSLPRALDRGRDRASCPAATGRSSGAGGAHGRRLRGPGVRAGGAGAQPPARRALAAGAPAGGQRVGGDDGRGRRGRRGHRRQRAGLPGARRGAVRPPVVLPGERGAPRAARGGGGVPAAVLRQLDGDPAAGDRPAGGGRAAGAGRGAGHAARRAGGGARRPSAATGGASWSWPSATPRLALDQERLKDERRRQRRAEALDGLQSALRLDAPPIRIECFDVSNLGGTHTVASMVVFEGGAPRKSDYRRFTSAASRAPTTSPPSPRCSAAAWRRFEATRDLLAPRPRARPLVLGPAQPDRDRRRQGPAVQRAGRPARLPRARGGGGGAGQADRGGVPARPRQRRWCSTTRRPSSSSSSACATRPTASPSPTTASAATGR